MSDNPYSANCAKPTKPPEDKYQPTWRDRIVSTFFFVLFVGLTAYGLIRLMHDLGIVFHDRTGEAHFWFEPKLHEWIHR